MGTVFADAIVLPVLFYYFMYLGVRWYLFCCSKVWYFGDLSVALLRQSYSIGSPL